MGVFLQALRILFCSLGVCVVYLLVTVLQREGEFFGVDVKESPNISVHLRRQQRDEATDYGYVAHGNGAREVTRKWPLFRLVCVWVGVGGCVCSITASHYYTVENTRLCTLSHLLLLMAYCTYNAAVYCTLARTHTPCEL